MFERKRLVCRGARAHGDRGALKWRPWEAEIHAAGRPIGLPGPRAEALPITATRTKIRRDPAGFVSEEAAWMSRCKSFFSATEGCGSCGHRGLIYVLLGGLAGFRGRGKRPQRYRRLEKGMEGLWGV